MKRTTIYAAVALFLATVSFATERFAPVTGSMVRIEGTSTIHEWKMEGATINGQVAVAENWQQSLAGANVNVSIPVTSIKSENDRMDRLMANALKAKANPEIRYEMTGGTLTNSNANAFTVKTKGRLAIAGVTRDVAMDVAGARASDGTWTLTGQAPIKMTDSVSSRPPR